MADVKKTVAPTKSSPPKKGEQSNKPSSPKQQVAPVHESDAYFTVKTSKDSYPVTSVHVCPIKFKDYIVNKEQLKRSYQTSDFKSDIEISPSRHEMKKTKKVDKSMYYDVHK